MHPLDRKLGVLMKDGVLKGIPGRVKGLLVDSLITPKPFMTNAHRGMKNDPRV